MPLVLSSENGCMSEFRSFVPVVSHLTMHCSMIVLIIQFLFKAFSIWWVTLFCRDNFIYVRFINERGNKGQQLNFFFLMEHIISAWIKSVIRSLLSR